MTSHDYLAQLRLALVPHLSAELTEERIREIESHLRMAEDDQLEFVALRELGSPELLAKRIIRVERYNARSLWILGLPVLVAFALTHLIPLSQALNQHPIMLWEFWFGYATVYAAALILGIITRRWVSQPMLIVASLCLVYPPFVAVVHRADWLLLFRNNVGLPLMANAMGIALGVTWEKMTNARWSKGAMTR